MVLPLFRNGRSWRVGLLIVLVQFGALTHGDKRVRPGGVYFAVARYTSFTAHELTTMPFDRIVIGSPNHGMHRENGVYEPPVSGVYTFWFTGGHWTNDHEHLSLHLYKNDKAMADAWALHGTRTSITGHSMFHLCKGDQVTVRVKGTTYSDGFFGPDTTFSGFLVHPFTAEEANDMCSEKARRQNSRNHNNKKPDDD